MAVEAVKIIVGLGDESPGKLVLYDARTLRWREIGWRVPACPACGQEARSAD
jgi:hypothetical protein